MQYLYFYVYFMSIETNTNSCDLCIYLAILRCSKDDLVPNLPSPPWTLYLKCAFVWCAFGRCSPAAGWHKGAPKKTKRIDSCYGPNKHSARYKWCFFCCACSVSKPTWITWVQGIKTSEWICYTAHKRFNHARTLTSWVWVFPDMFISETCDDAFSDSAQYIAHVLHMCFTNWTSQYLFFWGT